MKLNKKTYMKFRNLHGEVVACVILGGEETTTAKVGFAFCNPNDFNLPRAIRVDKGHGIALKRALSDKSVPGSIHMNFDTPLGKMTGEERYKQIRERIVNFLKYGDMGFEPYTGKAENNFESWFEKFKAEL